MQWCYGLSLLPYAIITLAITKQCTVTFTWLISLLLASDDTVRLQSGTDTLL